MSWEKSDTLVCLQKLFSPNGLREVREEGDRIAFEDQTWPRAAKTNVKIQGTETSYGDCEYYTLGGVLDFLRLTRPQCFGPNPFTDLSDEIVVHILSFLSHSDLLTSVRRVNKRFDSLSRDSSLWITLSLPLHPKATIESSLAILEDDCCRRIATLDLSRLSMDAAATARAFGAFRGLEDLRISATATALSALASEHGQSVRRLRLDCGGGSLRFLEQHRAGLARLTHLKLQIGSRVHQQHPLLDARVLQLVAAQCRHLRSLEYVNKGYGVDEDALLRFLRETANTLSVLSVDADLFDPAAFAALAGFPRLRRVCLERAGRLDRSGLSAILSLPDLERLRLTHARVLRSEDFVAAFGGVSGGQKEEELTRLELGDCPYLDAAALSAVVAALPDLAFLAVTGHSGLTGSQMEDIVADCDKLRELHMPAGSTMPESLPEGLRRLVLSGGPRAEQQQSLKTKFPRLESVEVRVEYTPLPLRPRGGRDDSWRFLQHF